MQGLSIILSLVRKKLNKFNNTGKVSLIRKELNKLKKTTTERRMLDYFYQMMLFD